MEHSQKNYKKGPASTFKKAFSVGQGGFSLVELLVVAGIFATAVGAFFGAAAISFRAVAKASDKIQAAFLMEEGLEAVRYLRDAGWDHYLGSEELGYERCLYFDSASNMFATSTGSIVSHWHLDHSAGTTGAGSVTDTSTFTNNGTPTFTGSGAFGFAGVNKNGITNYKTAANFDGSGDYIATSKLANAMGLATGATLEAWVKPSSLTGIQNIINSSIDSGGFAGLNRHALVLNAGRVQAIIPIGVTNILDTAVLNTTEWHHIVATYTYTGGSGVFRLYVNGQERPGALSGLAPLDLRAFPYYIGARWLNSAPTEVFNGQIDEVLIYNRALSVTEVKDRYNGRATCRPSVLTDDNSKTFTRTVKFENVCRSDSTGDITGVTTCASGSTLNTETKKATVSVVWGDPAQRFVEKAEMYIADLFLN